MFLIYAGNTAFVSFCCLPQWSLLISQPVFLRLTVYVHMLKALDPVLMLQVDNLQTLPSDVSIKGNSQISLGPPSTMFRLHVPFYPDLVLGLSDALAHVSSLTMYGDKLTDRLLDWVCFLVLDIGTA